MNKLDAILLLLSSLYNTTLSYKISNEIITCYEHNVYSFQGYSDPIWSGDNCAAEVSLPATPEMCPNYYDEPNPGKGDVCDHSDPRTNEIRNMCYFNLRTGPYNAEKTYSFKCWGGASCPLGVQQVGCVVSTKHVTCCCNDADFCNGKTVYAQIAAEFQNKIDNGQDDFYTTDEANAVAQMLLDAGENVRNDVGTEGGTPRNKGSSALVGVGQTEDFKVDPAAYEMSEKDILLIFSYFMVGLVSCCIGMFVGDRLQLRAGKIKNSQYFVVDKDDVNRL